MLQADGQTKRRPGGGGGVGRVRFGLKRRYRRKRRCARHDGPADGQADGDEGTDDGDGDGVEAADWRRVSSFCFNASFCALYWSSSFFNASPIAAASPERTASVNV